MESDPYRYPGDERLLKNHLGITPGTPDALGRLARAEGDNAKSRPAELRVTPIPGNFDLKHMQSIHRHVFGDVYPWAGEIERSDAVRCPATHRCRGRGSPFAPGIRMERY